MFSQGVFRVAAVALALSPVAAVTQSAPSTQIVAVTFTGIVTDSVSDTIQIIQPNGALTPYTGPVPNIAFSNGDTITISMNSYNTPGMTAPEYFGQQSVDGQVKFGVNVSQELLASGQWEGVYAQFTDGQGGTAAYDAGAAPDNRPTLETSGGVNGGEAPVEVAQTNTPAPTGTATPTELAEPIVPPVVEIAPVVADAAPGTPTAFDQDTASTEGATTTSTVVAARETAPAEGGMPGPAERGMPIPVPEPGMLLLFGLAAALLFQRRRADPAA